MSQDASLALTDVFSRELRARAESAKKKAIRKALPGASEELQAAASEAITPFAEKWVRLLDDLVRIPGTKLGVGLDPILGLILPGAGDVVTGVGSMGLLLLALKHRVPTVIIGKMILNIAVDTLLGAVPVVGDAFDLLFRSNRRNLELIKKYRPNPEDPASQLKPRKRDYLLVGFGLLLATLSIALPIFIVYGLGLGAVLGLSHLFGG